MYNDGRHLGSETLTDKQNVSALADRREGERHIALLRVGKLITERSQELCLIRNISSGGLSARIYSPLAVGEHVSVELMSDHQVSGEVVWIRDSNIGVRFDEPIDVATMLAVRATLEDGRKPRAPRLEVPCRARLRIGAHYYQVEVRDLSQGGIKVEIGDTLRPDEEVVVTIEGLAPLHGMVRWSQDGRAGISFNTAIPLDTLTHWLAQRRTAQQRKSA